MTNHYITTWFKDFWGIATHELKQIFKDWGVLLIFVVAGLIYPILYNMVYLNGILNNTPIAVVDNSHCAESRRYIREVDATRECHIEYVCANMAEAEKLMQKRKVFGIILFPSDYGKKIANKETATISIYCDMSSFLYYKNALMAVNHVMLEEMNKIQIKAYQSDGYSKQEISQLISKIPYQENNPYNRAFSYSIFLISTILLIIIQQTMFYGMSLLVGTMREHHKSFASLPNMFHGHGVARVVLGRGLAYWVLYLAISVYITMIVPAIFGLPQRGDFWDVLFIVMLFVTDCVFFSMTWSTFITRRESVFILFLFMSPICLFLTGTSWPTTAFPEFWKWFSYLFPTTFGCKAYMNVHTAGGDLLTAKSQIIALAYQTIIYFITAHIAIHIENYIIKIKNKKQE